MPGGALGVLRSDAKLLQLRLGPLGSPTARRGGTGQFWAALQVRRLGRGEALQGLGAGQPAAAEADAFEPYGVLTPLRIQRSTHDRETGGRGGTEEGAR